MPPPPPPPPPPCSLHHPPQPTLSLPPPPKQTVQMPQLNQYVMKTTVNRKMVVLEEEELVVAASEDIAAEWDQFMDERRRQRRCARRRKRKKDLGLGFWSGEEGSGGYGDEMEDEEEEDEKWLFGPDRSMTLTKRQEAALSRFIQEGAMLENNNSQFTMESTHYSTSCTATCISSKRSCTRQKILLRARESEERIMTNYIRMVISVAATYEGSGLSFDDLVQEGCVGLLRGVRKFDPKKGNRLSTYVYWWIKQAIVRAIANNSRLVRLPVNLCEATSKVMKANSNLASRLGRKPTYAEIAEVVNLSASSVRIIILRNRKPFSLDQPVHKDGIKLKDVLSGPDDLRPELFAIRQLKLHSLLKVLDKLSEKERSVIRLRYGLDCERAQTFADIAKLIDVTAERARQIHSKAIRKLREEKGLIGCLMQQNLLTHVFE